MRGAGPAHVNLGESWASTPADHWSGIQSLQEIENAISKQLLSNDNMIHITEPKKNERKATQKIKTNQNYHV